MTKGGRNLIILGIVSTVIALVTAGVSLYVYHSSGDIYLDRSRPGFLPDEEEIEEEEESNEVQADYRFSDSGPIDAAVLDEYTSHLNIELEEINKLNSPFNMAPISDESLGIPSADS